jgi:hypothetical protein
VQIAKSLIDNNYSRKVGIATGIDDLRRESVAVVMGDYQD